ncbi:MAG: DUF1993 family protein [Sphingomonadales bacterium]|jgi:hypothetical protein|nr:DUF1993 family protein [Sphingomonadales bacterium]
MAVSLYSFVPMYRRVIETAAHLLAKGKAHAAAHDISEADMLAWTLAEDMLPLSFQLAVVRNFSLGWTARAADLPVPEAVIGAEMNMEAFEAAFAEAIAALDAMTADQFAGRDEASITFKIGDIMEPTLPAGQWITGFATTNIYFHLSMIYAILRMKGVALGKLDMFPAGL